MGERHFRRAVREFEAHYHGERNHQGLQNRLITGEPAIGTIGRVRRRSRLGGLLNYYERAACSVGSVEHWDKTGRCALMSPQA